MKTKIKKAGKNIIGIDIIHEGTTLTLTNSEIKYMIATGEQYATDKIFLNGRVWKKLCNLMYGKSR